MIVPSINKRNHHRFFIHETARETVKKGSAQQCPAAPSPSVKGKIVSITGKVPATPCGDREKRVLKCVA
jgi:hypothetical protein